MSYRDEYRSAASDGWWTLPRAFLAIFVVIVAFFLLMVLVTPLTIGFGWYSGEANLRGFQNVRATYAEAYDDTAALTATAQTICVVRTAYKAALASGDQNTISQRESQLLAYEANYNSVRGRYQAYMDDHFRGGIIHPKDLPLPFPTLAVELARVCG